MLTCAIYGSAIVNTNMLTYSFLLTQFVCLLIWQVPCQSIEKEDLTPSLYFNCRINWPFF